MTTLRKKYSAACKLKAVIAILKGDKTANEIASAFGVPPMQLSKWKKRFLELGPEIFNSSSGRKKEEDKQQRELYEQIGRLKMELEWLKKKSCLNELLKGSL